nr:uncharacterized protein LOC109768987 [Aegilops tauschii subsp. strangulata]
MEDESSQDSSVQYMNLSDDKAMHYRIPASIEDQDYSGIETSPRVLCHQHGVAVERRVAFEAFNTGRRFLVCPKSEDNNCEANYDKLVEDVHQLFNAQEDRMVDFSYLQAKMQNVHVSDSVVSDMKTEMGKKDAGEVDELKKSKEKLTQENTQLLLHMGDLKKGHDKLTARRYQLKIQIAELLKSEEKNTQKLKGILDILSE